jgi:MFS family permease
MRAANNQNVQCQARSNQTGLLPHLWSKADSFMSGTHKEAAPPGRSSRRLLWIEGLLSNASESFVGNFITPFALAYGATNGQVGALTSATNAASALGLLPGAKFEQRYGRRKWIFLLCTGLLGRLLLLALVLLPLLFSASMIVYGIIAVVVARGFLNQFCYPAWSSLVGDLVPEDIRGRYFGSRNIAVGIAALICNPIAGQVIRFGGIYGYQISFGLALLFGFVATLAFSRIREPKRPEAVPIPKQQPLGSLSTGPSVWDSPRFLSFTALAFLWHLSLQAAGPFFAVYQMRNLGATVAHIGLISSVGALASMAGHRIWGVQNDRRGPSWVMAATGLFIPIVPVMWIFVPNWWYLPLIEVFSSFLWAGYWLSNFNLLLELSPSNRRPHFVAVYQSVVSVASFVGPVLGGILVNVVTIKGLFWFSAGGRMTVSLLFVFLIARIQAKSK